MLNAANKAAAAAAASDSPARPSPSSPQNSPQLFSAADIDPSSLPGSSSFPSSPFEVSIFDQSVINDGRLHYIQSISNQSADSFVFDVTNGISDLAELTFHFTILPKTLYVETRELTVTEGRSATLTSSHLHVLTSYFEDKIQDWLVVDPPTSGKLVLSDRRKSQVTTIFSVDDLESGVIEVGKKDSLLFYFLFVPRFWFIALFFVRPTRTGKRARREIGRIPKEIRGPRVACSGE